MIKKLSNFDRKSTDTAPKKIINYYLLSLVFLLLFTLLMIGIFYYNDLKRQQTVVRKQVATHIQEQKELISDYFIDLIVSDLMYLAESDNLLNYAAGNDEIGRQIAVDWKRFIEERRIYDQIRFLDKSGQERIRVNYDEGQAQIVPLVNLQFKGERYYFADTFKLSHRGVYVSPFDLNIEQGAVERPLKPMIRFGTPVFNGQQEKVGVLILNYLGQDLINKINKQAVDNSGQFMLLNNKGYWLYHPVSENRWGFMLEERKKSSFKTQFPQAWKEMADRQSGQITTPEGFFAFTTVYPLSASWLSSTGSEAPFAASKQLVTAENYYWKLVSYIPHNFFRRQSLSLIKKRFKFIILLCFMLLIINIPITYLLLEWKMAKEKLKKNANYYKSLFKTNNMITLLINPKTGYIKDANATALAFYGYSKEELLNKKITDINILSKQEVFAEMKQAQNEHRNYFEFTHQLADGSFREVEVYSKPIIIDGKEFLYSFIYDITEREDLEEEVKEQKKRYKLLFETTGTAIFIVEADATISLVNHQAEILTDYSKAELETNLKFQELIAYPEEEAKMLKYHQGRKQGQTSLPNRYEFSLRNKEGVIKEVLINIKLIPDTKQSIISLTDVTENRRQQRKLHQAYNKLNENFKTAKSLHQRFLPTEFPEIKELSFAAYYQPAEKIGGDFYNYIQLDNKFIFYVADITGHGLDGAMLNIFVRETINNYIIEVKDAKQGLKPNKIIEYVFKKYKQEKFPPDYFISLIIGVLDITTYEVEMSNMGIHILPCFTDKNGQLSTVAVFGLPITNTVESKFYRAEKIKQKSFVLKPGATLFLTTDGLIEERRGQERYGEDRLKKIIKNTSYFPPQLIADRITTSFKNFALETTSKDDVTFLILQRERGVVAEFSKVVNGDMEVIYQLHDQIRKFISRYELPVEPIMVATQEILVNAFEHGNGLDSSKQIAVEIKITVNYIEIAVVDEGTGFDWPSILNGENNLEHSYDLDNLEVRGRGLLIAQALMDEVTCNLQGNKVYLYKFRSASE